MSISCQLLVGEAFRGTLFGVRYRYVPTLAAVTAVLAIASLMGGYESARRAAGEFVLADSFDDGTCPHCDSGHGHCPDATGKEANLPAGVHSAMQQELASSPASQ